MVNPDSVTYPFPVVWSTESGGYRRATVAEIDGQLRAQASVSRDVRGWKRRNEPDASDKTWANYVEFVRMVERAPFPPKNNARSWDLRQGRTRKAIPANTVLAFVGRDPSKHTRSDRVQW